MDYVYGQSRIARLLHERVRIPVEHRSDGNRVAPRGVTGCESANDGLESSRVGWRENVQYRERCVRQLVCSAAIGAAL